MASEDAGTRMRGPRESVDDLPARMNLQEEEDDDFVWEEELPDLTVAAKWLAIARVHTPKIFSTSALYGDMRAAWNPARHVVWRKINGNLFTTHSSCLADWNKAMLEGPWLFRGQTLIMKEYDGVWAQIHRLPDNFLIDQTVCGMATHIGEVEEIQLRLPTGFFGEFVRVEVSIDINAKIKRFVTGKKGDERVRYQARYEKLPTFCFNCGEFGHWYEECGGGEHDESGFGWGKFVLADAFRAGHAGRGVAGPLRGRGSRGRAGGGRGRGKGKDAYNPNQSWCFNAQNQNLVNVGGRKETDRGEDEYPGNLDETHWWWCRIICKCLINAHLLRMDQAQAQYIQTRASKYQGWRDEPIGTGGGCFTACSPRSLPFMPPHASK
ncbi:hypothetical protein ZWY2020_040798 [Hordeum vulgare]|nr:hypothetical protein ZWY2020_040798 [Hordeum vulgare]